MFLAQMPDPATSTTTPLPVQQSIQSLSTIPLEEYIVPGVITSAGEFVPDPSPATRHDTLPTVTDAGLLVRTAAEALHFHLELLSLLVRELGGDWSATTISELTTIPSSDVESAIRGLQFDGVAHTTFAARHVDKGLGDLWWQPRGFSRQRWVHLCHCFHPHRRMSQQRAPRWNGRGRPARQGGVKTLAGVVASGAEAHVSDNAGGALGFAPNRCGGRLSGAEAAQNHRVSLDRSSAARAMETTKGSAHSNETAEANVVSPLSCRLGISVSSTCYRHQCYEAWKSRFVRKKRVSRERLRGHRNGTTLSPCITLGFR